MRGANRSSRFKKAFPVSRSPLRSPIRRGTLLTAIADDAAAVLYRLHALRERENGMSGIPVLHVEADCIARGWENSLLELHRNGCTIRTQYDKPGDPPSKDCTMILTIREPLHEPMIHKDFPGGPEELQEYVMEVCEGIKDHLVRNPEDPADTRWEYTYHRRLFVYDVPGFKPFDQIETMCRKLAEVPHTRRAQAITWKVWEDNDCFDPPCLQNLWARLSEENNEWVLSLNARFRSNDAYKAAFMNIFALVQLQKKMAERISAIADKANKGGPLLPYRRQLSSLRFRFQGI